MQRAAPHVFQECAFSLSALALSSVRTYAPRAFVGDFGGVLRREGCRLVALEGKRRQPLSTAATADFFFIR